MTGFLAMVVRSKAQNGISLCLDSCLSMNIYDRGFCSGLVIASVHSSLGRVSFRLVSGVPRSGSLGIKRSGLFIGRLWSPSDVLVRLNSSRLALRWLVALL